MEKEKLSKKVLGAFMATALTVLLQEAIETSKGTTVWKQDRIMKAKTLYNSLEKYMMQIYKTTDDPTVVSFHTLTNILERLVEWLGESETLDDFVAKLDNLSTLTEGKYYAAVEKESFPSGLEKALEKAMLEGWYLKDEEWQRDGYRSKSTAELYEYIKRYYPKDFLQSG